MDNLKNNQLPTNNQLNEKNIPDKKLIGNLGEKLAAQLLLERGYEILRKNYNSPFGELDIVALKDQVLTFVEVKTRLSSKYGTGREAVDYFKRKHIRNTADYYIQQAFPFDEKSYNSIEFQVIEITGNLIRGLKF